MGRHKNCRNNNVRIILTTLFVVTEIVTSLEPTNCRRDSVAESTCKGTRVTSSDDEMCLLGSVNHGFSYFIKPVNSISKMKIEIYKSRENLPISFIWPHYVQPNLYVWNTIKLEQIIDGNTALYNLLLNGLTIMEFTSKTHYISAKLYVQGSAIWSYNCQIESSVLKRAEINTSLDFGRNSYKFFDLKVIVLFSVIFVLLVSVGFLLVLCFKQKKDLHNLLKNQKTIKVEPIVFSSVMDSVNQSPGPLKTSSRRNSFDVSDISKTTTSSFSKAGSVQEQEHLHHNFTQLLNKMDLSSSGVSSLHDSTFQSGRLSFSDSTLSRNCKNLQTYTLGHDNEIEVHASDNISLNNGKDDNVFPHLNKHNSSYHYDEESIPYIHRQILLLNEQKAPGSCSTEAVCDLKLDVSSLTEITTRPLFNDNVIYSKSFDNLYDDEHEQYGSFENMYVKENGISFIKR